MPPSLPAITRPWRLFLAPPAPAATSPAPPPCRLIRDFERDAKADNMPIEELNYRKKQLVQELNSFIGLKKAYGAHMAPSSPPAGSSWALPPCSADPPRRN